MQVRDWIMDSGAFTEISAHGQYRSSVAAYAAEIRRWATNGSGNLMAAAAQDWMCESPILKRAAIADGSMPAPTWFCHDDPNAYKKLVDVPWPRLEQGGEQIAIHHTRTIERYEALLAECTGTYILPVLQGFAPTDYVRHLRSYGRLLSVGAWVGVGSVCKRNGDPRAVAAVLHAIKAARPDLRLHGFGLKTTAIAHPLVRSLLETADSMAWSLSARKQGRNANDWREAVKWQERITTRPVQYVMDLLGEASQ